jgi:hypothetical protein
MAIETTTAPLVEVVGYSKLKLFEIDAQRRLSSGWTLMGQSGDAGQAGLGSATAGYLIAGVPGMLAAQSLRTTKTVVTWMHPNPSAWQIRVCEARRAGKKSIHIDGPARTMEAMFWGILGVLGLVGAIGSLWLGPSLAPLVCMLLLAVAVVAVVPLIVALRGGKNVWIGAHT